jgi:hypothetical protein
MNISAKVITAPLRRLIFLTREIRTRAHNRLVYGKRSPRRNEIVYVDPRKIRGHMTAEKRGWSILRKKTGCDGSAIVAGDWDLRYVDYLALEETSVYKSCYMRWVEGREWSETTVYQEYVSRLDRGETFYIKSHQHLVERYAALDAIFERVSSEKSLSSEWHHLVRVSISRDGSFIWGYNGRHRVCIALCAGVEEIPMRLGFVHEDAVDAFQSVRRL